MCPACSLCFLQGLDLLQSPKDHSEFTLVREWIKQQLAPLCTGLAVEVKKSVLKQATVQHLYGRLAGLLKRGVGDAAILAALHPTPAVCGRPREAALEYLQNKEPFDRGFYAGPFGWVSGQGAEFAVAIRSAMLPVVPAAAGVDAAPAAAAATGAPSHQQVRRCSVSTLKVGCGKSKGTARGLSYIVKLPNSGDWVLSSSVSATAYGVEWRMQLTAGLATAVSAPRCICLLQGQICGRSHSKCD